MEFASKYIAKPPDSQGYVAYTDEENAIWKELIIRQKEIVKTRACQEFLEGLDILNLPTETIPQVPEMNKALHKATGWSIYPVAALIPADYFFELLSKKQFPAATFIRVREELDYLQEPDIFHEIFGHCPMLTNPVYADFMQKYGEIALRSNTKERELLQRLYWFTVEFGLIQTNQGIKCYGGGILSSKEETIYAIESPIPKRMAFNDGMDALRTPYRIDIVQPVYFVIEQYDNLYRLLNHDLSEKLTQAQALGEYPPLFEPQKPPPEGIC